MGILVGVDIGGTFTDVVALNTSAGGLSVTKTASTPAKVAEAFFSGLEKILGKTNSSGRDVERLIHGTTIATNAITEARGAEIGILTTEGFEDVIILGRQARSDMYNLFHDVETPTFLCPRHRIMGIKGRLAPDGSILTPLDEDGVAKAVDYLVQKYRVEAIAVCYLFSFIDSSFEQRTKQIIRERYPNMRVSLSSTVNPRFREYQRMAITAFDAYVGLKMEAYIRELEKGLHSRHIDVVLQVMQSRGGITNAAMCVSKPVITLLSGPAAGVVGGTFIGKLCDRENLITLDKGGTTNDVALVQHGEPFVSTEGKIGKYPLRQSMVDINTIGAGGGSIAWVDAAGGLKVGPQSAGADPGPACYARGGKKPTVTDASVILSYLAPEYFADGELVLQPELAREAIRKNIAEPLGMEVAEAAAGIHQIVNNNMADQIRLVSVHKGYDPRDFSLVSFGGAGPVNAGRLMQILEMKEAIVPVNPGVLSALGLIMADIEHEEVASYRAKADEIDPKEIMKVFRRLEEVCEQKMKGLGMLSNGLRVRRLGEARYIGQSYEIDVPFPEGKRKITKDVIKDSVKRFHEVHQTIYGHSTLEAPVEFMAFRVVYSQKQPRLTLQELSGTRGIKDAPKSVRQAYFDEYKGFVDTPIYRREELIPRQKLTGPAIVEQADATTVLYPNQVGEVDKWGNIIIRVG